MVIWADFKERFIMNTYRGLIKLKVSGSITTTYVEIVAQSAYIAKALLAAQYGNSNVLNVIRK